MKFLILCSTVDITKSPTATPFIIQLLKGFHEEGNELHVIPYYGKPIKSSWWTCYENPNYYKGLIFEKVFKPKKRSTQSHNTLLIGSLAHALAKPKIEKLIKKILSFQRDIDAVLIMGVPLNQIDGIARSIKQHKSIPVIYYDLDAPISLPSMGGFKYDYYSGTNLTDYDAFLLPSEGVIKEVSELGARNIHPLHLGVDPDFCSPIQIEQDIDIFFMGTGGKERQKNLEMMITKPSKILPYKFLVSGRNLDLDLGKAKYIEMLNFDRWKKYACRSKINLNIVRKSHTTVFASSTARPFELASMECCVVSSPYSGLEKWFDTKNEMLIANSSEECIEIYRMLMENNDLRLKIGKSARARVLKEHTTRHRARQIIDIIKAIN